MLERAYGVPMFHQGWSIDEDVDFGAIAADFELNGGYINAMLQVSI